VDEEEAHERLLEALAVPAALADIQRGLSTALATKESARTSADQLLDRIRDRLGQQSGRVRAAPASAGIAAVLVRLNLELGLAPETLRATLTSEKGAKALEQGLAELGLHLVRALLRSTGRREKDQPP
jgi:hypothetical protein